MSERRQFFWPLLGLAGILQTAALSYIIVDRQRHLQSGREVLIPVAPVDPRDLFRGDFVRLGYQFSILNAATTGIKSLPPGVESGGNVYVTLTPAGEGRWTARSFAVKPPADIANTDFVLKGRAAAIFAGSTPEQYSVTMHYGIERFFLAEGTGRTIERSAAERKVSTIVALRPDGSAAIKGLMIDGERHEDPPLF